MISVNTLLELALAFPKTTEQPHFDKTSFRVGKKIIAEQIDLTRVPEEMVKDALRAAYCEVAPRRLVELMDGDESI